MLIVGLTGSIGMGKSTAAARFRARGYAVFDADAEVHRLYREKLAAQIEAAFPGTTRNGAVDRDRLSAVLIASPGDFKKLTDIVHPAVRASERDFLHQQARAGARLAVVEIPLLFENRGDRLVDVVIVVSADAETQRSRVLQRPGMTAEKLNALLAWQTPDAEKRRRADFVVDTSGSIAACDAQIDAIVANLVSRDGAALAAHWR